MSLEFSTRYQVLYFFWLLYVLRYCEVTLKLRYSRQIETNLSDHFRSPQLRRFTCYLGLLAGWLIDFLENRTICLIDWMKHNYYLNFEFKNKCRYFFSCLRIAKAVIKIKHTHLKNFFREFHFSGENHKFHKIISYQVSYWHIFY